MFHPVGSQPPSVYWRRRLMLVGAIVLALVLIALTVSALHGGNGGGTTAASKHPTTSPAPSPTPRTTTRPPSSSSRPASSSTTTGAHVASGDTASTATSTCTQADLEVMAVVGKSTYSTTENPLLELQVTNDGKTPCVQDMADKQIELSVYNGSSRVWGSHDCAVKSGTDLRTLAVGQPYRSAILWTGLTSDPKCQDTRQRVGAGSYTLYAKLSGQLGKAAQFTIE